MPEECASMRSMARWVLPVLVGPSTAVTPAPRARTSRVRGAENETGISDRLGIPMATERKPGHMGCTSRRAPARGTSQQRPPRWNSAVLPGLDFGLALAAAHLAP